MAKSENQKLKLLYIVKILNDEADETNPISTQQLIDRLADYDIAAERKSIYSDIRLLQEFGYSIAHDRGKLHPGYYFEKRDFSVAELKILVDAVQASKFISLKKSRELIKKLGSLAGRRHAGQLQRQVYVMGRVKTENDKVLAYTDLIHDAIRDGKQMIFRYYQYTVQKEQKLRKNGEYYHVSPWALTWNDENYYLVGFDEEDGRVKNFRVDKMEAPEIDDKNAVSRKENADFDIAVYTREMFSMFGGETEIVTLRFEESLIGVMVDRFGKEIEIRAEYDQQRNASDCTDAKKMFRVRVTVAVSNQFFGWMAGFGNRAEIMAPPDVRKQYGEYIAGILLMYGE